jgi:hypothetical protein
MASQVVSCFRRLAKTWPTRTPDNDEEKSATQVRRLSSCTMRRGLIGVAQIRQAANE